MGLVFSCEKMGNRLDSPYLAPASYGTNVPNNLSYDEFQKFYELNSRLDVNKSLFAMVSFLKDLFNDDLQ